MLKGAKLVENAAERPYIAFVIIWLLLTKFRTQVIWSSDDSVSHVLCLVEQLGHTQIPDFDLVIFAQKHIDGLDISMQYFVGVQVS